MKALQLSLELGDTFWHQKLEPHRVSTHSGFQSKGQAAFVFLLVPNDSWCHKEILVD